MAVTLQLTVPSPIERKNTAPVKPDEVAAWLDNLPFLDLQRTAPAIHKQLRLFNRQPMTPSQRLAILAAFRHAYGRLKHTGTERPADAPPPMEGLCKKLSQDMTFGYKLALQDMLNARWSLVQRRALGQAITGAIEGLGEHMTYFYAAAQRTPRALWNEATALFRYASEKKLDDVALSEADGGSINASTVFRTIALLRLADPYQMQPGTIWQLRDYFKQLVEQTRLIDAAAPANPERLRPLVIDSPGNGEPPLLLDVTGLMEQIEASLGQLQQSRRAAVAGFPNEMPASLVAHTLKRVQATWSTQIDRRWDRTDVNQRLELAVGVSACWCVANGGRPFDPALYSSLRADEIGLGEKPGRDTTPQTPSIYRCNSINRSAGGLALQVQRAAGTALHPGQIVALRRSGSTTRAEWVIGVCRWLIERGNSADIGVQFIARFPKPVAITRPDARLNDAVLPALVTEQTVRDTPVRHLITACGTYRDRSVLDLYENGHHKLAALKRLVDSSQDFEQFVFAITETADA